MVDISIRQLRVSRRQVDRLHQEIVAFFAERAGFFPPIFALDAASVFNNPHSGPRAGFPAFQP
jgi:hypothetical protein